MESFANWLIIESIDSLKEYKPIINIIAKNNIPQDVADKIFNLAATREEKEQVPYAQYLLGFYTKKPNARDEDFVFAVDNYTFFKRNKQRLYPSINGQPFEIGQQNEEIQYIKDNNVSNTRAKKQGKMLDGVDFSRVKEQKFDPYTFYTIPKANNPQEKLNNKQLYCLLGKNTQWCTASPDGTYYEMYVEKLNITVVYKDKKPLYQFGFPPSGVIDGISQFMDVDDRQPNYIPQDLFDYINNSEFKPILNLRQFDEMRNLANFDTLSPQEQKLMVSKNPDILQLIKNPTEELFIVAINADVKALRHIPEPSEAIVKAAVKKWGYTALRYISNPSDEVVKSALVKGPDAIKEIKDPSEAMKEFAVQSHGSAIQHIKNPSEKIQKIAIAKDPNNLKYIKSPSEDIQLMAVKKNGFAIKHITSPNHKVQLAAVKQAPTAISAIVHPNEEIQKEAIKGDPFAIQNIKDASEEIIKYAIQKNPHVANYIRNLSPALKDFAAQELDRSE